MAVTVGFGAPLPVGAADDGPSDDGTVSDWFVQVAGEPLAVQVGQAKQRGRSMDAASQRSARSELRGRQESTQRAAATRGAEVNDTLTDALNGLIVRGTADQVQALRAEPDVTGVFALGIDELSLGETVPHVGGTALHELGLDGTGVTVAVLDDGIDYTHAAFGGPGTRAAFDAAVAARDADSLAAHFPTEKVIGGHDFISNNPNPIGQWAFGAVPASHGTPVADIIAGKAGMAPGASLYALRVCHYNCPQAATLPAVEWALDPNRDGDLSDHADVLNLSLGSNFGSASNPLAVALNNAALAGAVAVAAAGNGGDHRSIVGSPSVATEVISVAQAFVPGTAVPLDITAPAEIVGRHLDTATLSWAPLDGVLEGEVVFAGRGCRFDSYTADPAGKIALFRSGSCSWGERIDRAAKHGVTGVLIDDDAPMEWPGDGKQVVPSLVIDTSAGDAIRSASGPVMVRVDPANAVRVDTPAMTGTSSRGPVGSDGTIKPDIGAPGASMAAASSTGTGTRRFGGTSGAAPVVAGAAALLLQAFPDSTPREIKARMMGTAFTDVRTTRSGPLAPVARIGAGELRVQRAHATTMYALDANRATPSLSYGRVAPSKATGYPRTLTVTNTSGALRHVQVEVVFRDPQVAALGVVKMSTPQRAALRPDSSAPVRVVATVDPANLPSTVGAAGLEVDGYVRITDVADQTQTITVPWLVIVQPPR